MSAEHGQAPVPTITVAEMNGRIEELERQRDAALTRCATLSGVNALLRQTLAETRTEFERLNAPAPAAEASPAAPETEAPTLN